MLYMHSYTYRGQPLERVARKCREYGYDGLELVTLHYDRTDPDGSIPRAAEVANSAGTRIAVVDFSGSVVVDDAAQRRGAIDHVAQVIRLAGRIGAEGVNGSVGSLFGENPSNWSENGSRIAASEHYQRATEAYQELSDVASDAGVWISFEVHMNTPHDTAATTRRLLDMIDRPNVIGNLDPGNMYAVADAEAIPEAVMVLGNRLGYVHLKNCRAIGGEFDYTWPLDSGDIDYYRGLQAVVDSGYRGHYCIEYCGKGDPSIPAKRDAAYFRELMSELG
ncbi:MAG: sugar phosphate isomerase/epimerase family protein [Actinomycetota bacterium]